MNSLSSKKTRLRKSRFRRLWCVKRLRPRYRRWRTRRPSVRCRLRVLSRWRFGPRGRSVPRFGVAPPATGRYSSSTHLPCFLPHARAPLVLGRCQLLESNLLKLRRRIHENFGIVRDKFWIGCCKIFPLSFTIKAISNFRMATQVFLQ